MTDLHELECALEAVLFAGLVAHDAPECLHRRRQTPLRPVLHGSKRGGQIGLVVPVAVGSVRLVRLRPLDFDGPLDVILLLLSKNKIEIQDIQISAILEQYHSASASYSPRIGNIRESRHTAQNLPAPPQTPLCNKHCLLP